MNRRRPTGDRDARSVAAFDDLYETTFAQVLPYCRRRTRSIQDAEDAVAETYLVAWRKLDDATKANSPLLWLYSVAFRITANQRRGRIRFERLIDRLSDLFTPTHGEAPDAPILADTDAAEVAAALDILSPTDREIIRLVAYERLSHTDAGAVLSLSPAAVRTRLYRARRRLRRHLDDRARRDIHAEPDTNTDEGPTGNDPSGPWPRNQQP